MSNLPPESSPDWSDEELLLLRSAEDDRPSAGSLAATLAAVGVGTAAVSAVSSAATAHAALAAAGKGAGTTAVGWLGATGAAKWLSIVAIAGAITVSGIAIERHASKTERARPPAQAQRPRDPARSTPAAREQIAAPPVAPETTPAAPPQATAVAAPQPARPKPFTRNEPPAPPLSPSQPDLTREIATIDAARVALRRGAGGEALAALDRYDTEYAKTGSLKLEASALRIEALFSHGDRARASVLARTFLSRHPKSPYAAAIRKLVTSAPR